MKHALFAFALAASAISLGAQTPSKFTVVEATIPQLQAAMAKGQVTSRQLVEQYLQRRGVERSDTIVLDPPRTGLSPQAMSGLLGLKAPRLVYVSCDPATLARDVRRLVDAGYELKHIEGFDLFPNTAHIETLAVLVQ